jgi:hypothetical protein
MRPLAELKSAGVHDAVVIPTAKHLQIRWQTPRGDLRLYHCASTGSDRRGPKNVRADIRRLLRGDGLLPVSERPDPPATTKPRDWRREIDELRCRVNQLEAKLARGGVWGV